MVSQVMPAFGATEKLSWSQQICSSSLLQACSVVNFRDPFEITDFVLFRVNVNFIISMIYMTKLFFIQYRNSDLSAEACYSISLLRHIKCSFTVISGYRDKLKMYRFPVSLANMDFQNIQVVK